MKKNFIITPKKISLVLFTLFLALVAIYFYREVCFLIKPPKLEIIQPPADISVMQKNFEIIGKTEPTAFLKINDQETYLDPAGNFKKELNLSQGLNIIKIEAKNRFNKSNIIIRRIIYEKTNTNNR
jgi:hypothetical protein